MSGSSLVPRLERGSWMLLLILGLSAGFNLTNIDFPTTLHGDESSKVEFIRQWTQNFNHPILMLQVVRGMNLVFNLSEPLDIAILGRALMGLCGIGTVLLSYVLARRTMQPPSAAAVALAVAVSPLLVVHSHYLKEDTILTTWLMAAALCFMRFCERLDGRSAVVAGIATGLAFSSHYKAILLVPLYLIAPLLATFATGARGEGTGTMLTGANSLRARRFLAGLSLAGLVSGVVFLAINWPLVNDPQTFRSGVLFEAEHVQAGHDVPIEWNDYWLGFHLLHSLVPGIGVPATMLAIGGLVRAIARWNQAPLQDRWLAAYVLVFYVVPELSPLKPWPDFSRYMMPIVPPLLYFGWQGIEHAAAMVSRRRGRPAWVVAGGAAALVLVPLYMSARLVSGLASDTRAAAAAWLERHPGTAIGEAYSGETNDPPVRTVTSLNPAQLRAEKVDYLVASSFMYDRFAMGARLRNKDPDIYETHARYVALFARPYVEMAPAYRTFGFSNPVIRIIDVREPTATTGH
jgi:Dolichyl-phosphate-mannose-protein mannosyltransferase